MIDDELIVPALPRWATVSYTEPYESGACMRRAAVLVHSIAGATATVELREHVGWANNGGRPPIYDHPHWFEGMIVGEVRCAQLVDLQFIRMVRGDCP